MAELFVLRGATVVVDIREPGTTLKTDTNDESDRPDVSLGPCAALPKSTFHTDAKDDEGDIPDVAADCMRLAPTTTYKTAVEDEGDQPDVGLSAPFELECDGLAVGVTRAGRSFFEALVFRAF